MIGLASFFLPLILMEIMAAVAFVTFFHKSTHPYSYRITDLWAVTVGLTPTMMLTAFKPMFYWTNEHVIVLSIVLAISQLIGMFLGRLFAGPAMSRTKHATATSAIFILAGATCGFIALFVYIFLIQLLLGRSL
jgi:hypothetical protein